MTRPSTKLPRSPILTRALVVNAAFSGSSGLALVVANDPAGTWLGVPDGRILLALGLGLLAFSAALVLLARSPRSRRPFVMAATASDGAWVFGSAVLLVGFPDLLTTAGNLTVGAVAVVVAALGIAQVVGLQRTSVQTRARDSSPDPSGHSSSVHSEG